MPGESRTVHGIHPVLEALRAHPGEVERVYVLEGSVPPRAAAEILTRAREAKVRVERVPRERLAALVEGGVHQGVVGRLREFAYAELDDVLAAATGLRAACRWWWCWTGSRTRTTSERSSARRTRWARTGWCSARTARWG